jgi:acyl-CoA dehydrogenase
LTTTVPPARRDETPIGSVVAAAARIAADVAGPHADEVDRAARFPQEAVDALRRERLLGAYVPPELGGAGCSVDALAAACRVLGQHCASTAMIFAMHQIEVACIVHHAAAAPFFRRYLSDIAKEQRLIASATSEAGVGGDLRTSICAVEPAGGRVRLWKDAPVISYGAEADDILVTARRAPDAAGNDQVMLLVRRGERDLEPTGTWDALGFRGTCSLGFRLTADCGADQLLPVPFGEIASRTMLPVSHLLWSSVWLGIAIGAVQRARAFVRAEARRKPGTPPPASLRLAEVVNELQLMRANVESCTREYETSLPRPEALDTLGFAIRMNNLKLASSEAVVRIVGQALTICGMAGYKNDTRFSLGRQLRDAYGAALMINNDRIYGANASMLLVQKDD